jgi:MarR family transcriptional regulator, temperature-dependent positive regulator of motility
MSHIGQQSMIGCLRTIFRISTSYPFDGAFMPKSDSSIIKAATASPLPVSEPSGPKGAEDIAPFDPNSSPSHLLHRAQQIAADLHATAFGPSGLTQRQLAVLAALAPEGGVSQADLVIKTGIDRSTLAEMVARMEGKGLVAREKSAKDSRAKSVTMTDMGQEALASAMPRLRTIDQMVLAFLPSGRRDMLVELLTRIALPQPAKKSTKPEKIEVKAQKKVKKKKDRKKKKAPKD